MLVTDYFSAKYQNTQETNYSCTQEESVILHPFEHDCAGCLFKTGLSIYLSSLQNPVALYTR